MENKEELQDIEITCKECGQKFTHTVKDQLFYEEMKFKNAPKSCPSCRKAKKESTRRSI